MYKTLIFTLLIALSLSQSSSKCRILVLQSGNDLGAYQAGAFQGLVSHLAPEEVQYDVVSGVGVGALNAYWLSLFPKGQEVEAAQFMIEQWEHLKASDLYKERSGWNWYDTWFKEKSIYNSAPLLTFANSYNNYEIQRGLSFGAVNAANGEFLVFDETVDRSQLDLALVGALSTIPDFEYVQWENYQLIEGSMVTSLDAATPIERCQEEGFNNEDIIVDMIMIGTTKSIEAVNASSFNVPQVFKRCLQILNHNKGINDLAVLDDDYSNVEIRYTILPNSTLKDSKEPYKFTKREIKHLIETGEKDAATEINGVNIIHN